MKMEYNTAYLFPGQGSQYTGMGSSLIQEFPDARMIFQKADETLGFPLTTLIREGPEEELTKTQNAQPAILTLSIAIWETIKSQLPRPMMFAGHSLGEYSALVASGSLSFPDALHLVRERGKLMQGSESKRGGMTAIIGLPADRIQQLCKEHTSGIVCIGNYNSPLQTVITGEESAVREVGFKAKELKAKKVIPLKVSGAFHSPLMEPAKEQFSEILKKAEIRSPEIPLISNVTAEPVSSCDQIRGLLAEQIIKPILWTQTVEKMISLGMNLFCEIGPKNVLAGLLRRIDRGKPVFSIEDNKGIEKTQAFLEGDGYETRT